jgi:hypothetical protein
MRRELEAIHKFLSSRRKDVADNPLWRRITDLTETGTNVGKHIRFTARDLERLRQFVLREAGVDPTLEGLPRDRAIQAGRTSNEKLALGGVFETLVTFTRPTGGVIPVMGNPFVPKGAFLSIPAQYLLDRCDVSETVVVVENGQTLISSSQIRWPQSLSNPIVVYKGHGSSQKSLVSWLETLPREQVVAYFDFDPAGMMMASRYPAGACLIPKQWQAIHQNEPGNKLREFHLQSVSAKQMESASNLPADIRNHILQNRLSLTQEYLTARGFELTLCSIA